MSKKILLSIYFGFLIFSLLTFFNGTAGLGNMKVLKYFINNMEEHVESLEMKKALLLDEIGRLENSESRLKIAARPLGYVEPGQTVVKVLNYRSKNPLYNTDKQYVLPKFKKNTNRTLLVSSLFSVILFVISLFIGVIRDTYKR